MKSSKPLSSEVKIAEVKSPEVKISEVKSPEVKIAEVKSPEVKISEAKSPEVKIAEVKSPEVKIAEVKSPEVKAPEVKAPEVKAPEVKAPEIKMPEYKMPEYKMPEFKAPVGIEMPVVSENKLKNVLNVYKSVTTHYVSFEILIIRVIPYKIASIDIEILTDTGHIYRTVNLAGDDYLRWSSDDSVLFDYVRENLDTII